MFDKYGTPETTHWISAANAEYAYDNTANGSLLRKFVRNLVVSDKPLSRRAISDKKDPETMKSNGRGCGDIVLDVALESSFSNDRRHVVDGPYQPLEQSKCPLPIIGRSLEGFIKGKKGAGITAA